MRILICGHAALLVETVDQTILVDPVFTTSLVDGVVSFHPARQFYPSRMPKPTLVAVTHGHFDHFHFESVATLPRELPLLIPEDPVLQSRLEAAGFCRVRVIEPWQRLTLGGTTLTATASEYDEPEFGLIIKDETGAFWHMADGEVDVEA